ncbi:hypothetical protein AYO38_00160 [bacterium SCGC AG-212-C10]|nr:hypothetical protein AYO38_00160 [bacterium SCGC AG-212-C10]
MTNRYDPYAEDDEPVIGENYPLPSSRQAPVASPPAQYYDEDEWDTEYEDQYGDGGEPYYDDRYYQESPARQPIFYVFIGLAVILGAAFVVLLFALLRDTQGGGGGDKTPIAAAPQFRVQIDAPLANDRIETGKDHEVLASATSNERITKFELIVGSTTVDQLAINSEPSDKIYRATLRARFTTKGDYTIFVRVTSNSGATSDSEKVKVTAIEPVTDSNTVKGRVLTQVSLKSGPSDDSETVGTLASGQEVTIIARSKDNVWLQLNSAGNPWVRRSAIEPLDNLEMVPIRDGATTTPTATVSPSPGTPTPTGTATPPSTSPDFVPTGANLIDGGERLRVTIQNNSGNRYEGLVEVAVGGVVPGTLTQAFGITVAANGSTTVDFELSTAVTTAKTAQIRIDPSNVVRETNEDNNQASFSVAPPVEQPELIIATVTEQTGGKVDVSVRNTGGTLSSSTVTVRITVGANAAEQSKTISIAKDAPAVNFDGISEPGTGNGKVEVLINGQVVASVEHTFS